MYADEIGGEGEHRYVLMCLVALEDPGLTVFPTHRLDPRLRRRRRQEALARHAARALRRRADRRTTSCAPPDGDGPLDMGYIDAHFKQPFRLTLKDQAIADAALADMPEPYRRLDTAVLEALVLTGPLGLTDDDISHLRGLGYARSDAEALELVDSRRLRRRVLPASDPRQPDPRDRRGGHEHAPEVHLLHPEGSYRSAVQPAVITAVTILPASIEGVP